MDINSFFSKIINISLSNHLNFSKENRWLWKANFSSPNLISPLHTITQTKKFISNPIFSNFITNKNIWLSSHINDILDLQALNFIDYTFLSNSFFFKNFKNTPLQSFINHTEYSLVWALNRSFFTQNISCNIQTSIPVKVDGGKVLKNFSPIPNLYNLMLRDYSLGTNSYFWFPDISSSVFFTLSKASFYTSFLKTYPHYFYGGVLSTTPLLTKTSLPNLDTSFVSTPRRFNRLFYYSSF